MKIIKRLICILTYGSLLLITVPLNTYGQKNTAIDSTTLDSTFKKFIGLELNYYLYKNMSIFLTNDTIRDFYDEWEFMDYYKPYSLSGLYLYRKIDSHSKVTIEIFVYDYKYLEPVNFERDWNFDLLIREKIDGIKVSLCQKGKLPVILKKVGQVPER